MLVPRKVNGWAVEWSDDDSDAHDALRWDEHLRVFSPRWTTRFVFLALQAQQAAPAGGHIKLRLCWRRAAGRNRGRWCDGVCGCACLRVFVTSALCLCLVPLPWLGLAAV